MKDITVTFKSYHADSVCNAITDNLNEYLEDSRMAIADIDHIESLLESLYLFGNKQEARRYRKDLKELIRCSDNEREDIRFALEELRKTDFKNIA